MYVLTHKTVRTEVKVALTQFKNTLIQVCHSESCLVKIQYNTKHDKQNKLNVRKVKVHFSIKCVT